MTYIKASESSLNDLQSKCNIQQALNSLQKLMNDWNLNRQQLIKYNSLTPLIEFIDPKQNNAIINYYAVWNLANFTRTNRKKLITINLL